MTNLLFVYGTLIPGHEPAEMSSYVSRMKLVGPATIRGRLYDLGEYPGIELDDSAGVVKGRILSVPADEVWEALDEYEGCPRPGSAEGLFQRVRATACAEDHSPIDCWVYVYSQDLSSARLVECGCWLTHLRTSKISPP